MTDGEKQWLIESIDTLKSKRNSLRNEIQMHNNECCSLEINFQSLEERLRKIEHWQRSLISFLRDSLRRPEFLFNMVQISDLPRKKRKFPKSLHLSADGAGEIAEITESKPVISMDLEPFERMESSLNSLEKFFRKVAHASGESYDFISKHRSSLTLTELDPTLGETDLNLRCLFPELQIVDLVESTDCAETPPIPTVNHQQEQSKISVIDVNSSPVEERGKRATAASAPSGVNDLFWEQFLTETPGSSDNQETQPEGRYVDPAIEKGNFWLTRKNVDHITEQMGNLSPAEQTR